MIARFLVAAIRGYRGLVSPVLPPACRYLPTCSEYAITAIEKHGPVGGSYLALRRLGRCGPWHPGGFDPVP